MTRTLNKLDGTQQEQAQTVLLSSKELEGLGNELTDIMNVLEMNNIALLAVEITQKTDKEVFNWIAKKYIEIAYAQNKKLTKRLDEIAFLLLNNDNAKELEAVKK